MVHAIIFDMDGVLIDSQPMHYLGDQQTLAAHGVDVPVEAMTAYAGTTNQLRFELSGKAMPDLLLAQWNC